MEMKRKISLISVVGFLTFPLLLYSANEISLTHDSLENDQHEISPDGMWITYRKQSIEVISNDLMIGKWSQIYKAPMSGTGVEIQLSSDTMNLYEVPRWSPDGNWIVCIKGVYDLTSETESSYLYKIPSSGGSEEQLTCRGGVMSPEWSPDGLWIAYLSGDSIAMDFGIWKVSSSGRDETKIVGETFDYYGLQWSPDGNWIAYSKGDPSQHQTYQIYKVPSMGGTEMQITHENYNHIYPRWTSDGNWIHYSRMDSSGTLQIYKISSDGGSEIQITSGNIHLSSFGLSCDGNWVVYGRTDPSTNFRQIYKAPISGETEIQLTNENFWHIEPLWSPDCGWIVYLGVFEAPKMQIYKVSSSP